MESNTADIANIKSNYQPLLQSGSNIKTINGNDIVGSGDVTIASTGATVVQTLGTSQSDVISQDAVTNIITAPILNQLEEKTTFEALPLTGNNYGDGRKVTADGFIYTWNGVNWKSTGEKVFPIDIYLDGTYGNAGDGSRVIQLQSSLISDKDSFIAFDEYNPTYAILFTDSWVQLSVHFFTSKFERVLLPAGTQKIQTYFTETTNDPIHITIFNFGTVGQRLYNVEKFQQNAESALKITVDMFESIGAIGDSFTEGSMISSTGVWVANFQQAYISLMAKRNGISDYQNYGVGGTTTRTWLTHPWGLARILSEPPKMFYFLAHGINDSGDLNYLGVENDMITKADTFYGNYATIIDNVLARNPKAKLCCILIPLKRDENNRYEFCEAIKKIASYYEIPYIDPLEDSFFRSPLFLNQASGHPTCAGYNGMSHAYERLLSKKIMENSTYFLYSNIG